MLIDLDSLMDSKDIDVLIITGSSSHNPDMYYFTQGTQLTDADIIKVRGKEPVLFCSSIERDEADKTGMETIYYSRYPEKQLLLETGGHLVRSLALRYLKMLADVGVKSGKIALFGKVSVGKAFSIFNELSSMDDHFRIASYDSDDVLEIARATKSPNEVERIRSVGKKTADIMRLVVDLLSSHAVKNDQLVKPDGGLLTIVDVKTKIDTWLMERGLENPQGMIFALGKEAGIPHNPGTETQPIRLGVPIVFDIYPCEKGGGYYFDMTRTWCLGYATDETAGIHAQVKSVFDAVCNQLEKNIPFSDYQQLACELFETMGHKTVLRNPETEEGYVHGLGHGVGLYVHERPYSSLKYPFKDILIPGMVFTVEPGLYYPEKNIGCRLEDTFWVSQEGKFESLVEFPLDLVIPLNKS